MSRDQNIRFGFTLVELLVVVAIVGVLVSLLLPSLQAARETSRRLACQGHLRQLAIAAHSHHAAHNFFPPGCWQRLFPTSPTYRGSSLFVHMLPYLEQTSLRTAWEHSDPLINTVGGTAAHTAQVIPVFLCPSDLISKQPVQTGAEYYALTSYGGNGGTRNYHPNQASTDGMFHTTGTASDPMPNQRPVRILEVLDGTSHTLLLGERNAQDANFETFSRLGWGDDLSTWAQWAPSSGRKSIARVTLSTMAPLNYRLPFKFSTKGTADPPAGSKNAFEHYIGMRMTGFGSHHPGGANVVLVDGSVRMLAEEMPLAELRTLSTRAGED